MVHINANFPSSTKIPDELLGKPHFPQYQDGEDIISYLVQFDRVAELQNIDKGSFAVRLRRLLTTKDADIYICLGEGYWYSG